MNSITVCRAAEGSPSLQTMKFFLSAGSNRKLESDVWKRGFVQYQCVLRLLRRVPACKPLLEALAGASQSSFLAVLKRFGPERAGTVVVSRRRLHSTLDLPVSDPGCFRFSIAWMRSSWNMAGRVYLAKDARLKPETFRQMYPRLMSGWQLSAGWIGKSFCFRPGPAARDIAHMLDWATGVKSTTFRLLLRKQQAKACTLNLLATGSNT